MGSFRKYHWKTGIGTFYIAPFRGRFVVLFKNENLGEYATAQQALDDLVGGHTFELSSGIDTSTLNLPDEIGEWEYS